MALGAKILKRLTFFFCRRPSPGCLRRGDPSENDKEGSPEGEAEEHEHPHGQRFGVLAEESKLLSSKWDHRLHGDTREGLPTKRKVYLLRNIFEYCVPSQFECLRLNSSMKLKLLGPLTPGAAPRCAAVAATRR